MNNIDITYGLMIPMMLFFAKATHSFGWSIILLTLSIRVMVWPLVASSTKSMQRMAKLQPMMKELQTKYKDDPEMLRQETMKFYSENKMNPMSSCLPTLVQLPLLIALYATFMGPPFQDKEIPVKVTLAKPADANSVKIVQNPSSGGTSAYLSPENKLAKFEVQPGDQTTVWGRDASGQQTNQPNTMEFHIQTVAGAAPEGFAPQWKIQHDPNGATLDLLTGQATFPMAGQVIVEAQIPNAQPIEVPITVEGKPPEQSGFNFNIFGGGGSSDAFKTKTAQSADTRTVKVNGQDVTVAVTPGPSTVEAGARNVVFQLKAVNGKGPLPEGVIWHIVKDTNAATIDQNGKAVFPLPGEVTVSAVIPGVAKHERFYFVSSLGKVARGADLFKPQNWDMLAMLIAFAVTMYLSSQLMTQPTANMDPDQAAIQKQTQQTMPIAVTAMFFFIALPAGVFIYLVVSNVIQTLQTWLIYRTPSGGSGGNGGTPVENGGKISPESGGNGKDPLNGTDPGQKISAPKKKAQKNKK